ncbi:hypothetical protein BD560DRAFT_160439 [Blakeslea trispora]|nr:hypothetical protein BD560DRAFT_160439 [Blakeslea trispora]
MAQGAIKKAGKAKQKGGREKKGITKKGGKQLHMPQHTYLYFILTRSTARTVAPKKASLVKQRSMDKKLTAQINKSIERQMSVKANAVGKLTIMKKLAEQKPSAEDKTKIKRSSNARLT